MRITRLTVLAGLAAAGIAFLALACGGNGEETTAAPTRAAPAATEPAAAPTPPPATPTAAAVATSPAATPTEEAAAPPTPAGPTTQTLDISQVPTLRFDQPELRAGAGADITVRFNNTDSGLPHNWALYADEGYTQAIAGAQENICTGPCTGEVQVGPLDAGEYYFRCDVHPTQMQGELIVE